MADRFYVNSPLSPGELSLGGDEAHHLAVVCRLRPGQVVTLFNGDGKDYVACIVESGKRQVTLTIEQVEDVNRELPQLLHVAVPLPKGDRAQVLVEKLTELGVAVLTPLQTERSVVHPRETKLEKLHRYVIEASKQCGRNVLLEIEPLTDWATFVQRSTSGLRLVAHPGGTALRQLSLPTGSITIAVGPEGGFTEGEVNVARSAGWQVVSLGARILRVETAAIALAAWFAFHTPTAPL